MMACNDLVLVNSILGRYTADQAPSADYIRRGAGLYLVRVQMAHLYECFDVIRDIAASANLQAFMNRCPPHIGERFGTLAKYIPGGVNEEELEKNFGIVRSAITFHYDRKLIRRALLDRSRRQSPPLHKITTSQDIRRIRFEVADDIIDTLVCRHIWKIPMDAAMPDNANRFADSGFQLFRTVLDFAVPFVERFIEEFAAG